ncbi:DUF2249 domain-containing protein [Noviherbaspirillum galbum]|uniref:DUF2249 domain-containing protein n=1 Tax=Noviherbaspirillum galbum TaxID=2709383 RepID=A0A6B3SN09_9BURK|nr:DUF2249 domain-containing protein [Noviherbaspirillum galbum]NEX62270.1 DUF2249 domain-containing protein [Noviherbaspirillum galbum]
MEARIIELNVCGLEPPEPMERVLDALSRLAPQDSLRMLIDREPVPLYRILRQNRYRHDTTARDDGLYEILIRLEQD